MPTEGRLFCVWKLVGMSRRPINDGNDIERTLRGRIGAYSLHAAYDSRELTRAARRAFLDRFERQVDPACVLSPTERSRRAGHARKAYFAKLALASAKARRKRSTNGGGRDA